MLTQTGFTGPGRVHVGFLRKAEGQAMAGADLRAPVRLRGFPWVPMLLVLATGCGSEDYQDRLDTTSRYFASLELQDNNLHAAWNDPATTISLRVPKQFAELPGPAQQPAEGTLNAQGTPQPGGPDAEGAGSDEADDQPDPRQPGFLTIPLPGLRGAFRAPVSVVGENGRSATGSGYLYVLTNHHLAGNPDLAARFQADTLSELTSALDVSLQPDSTRDITLPQRPDAFQKPIMYTEVELEPEEQSDEMAREFGVATRFWLDSHSDGEVQVILLWVLPRDLDTSEKLSVRRPLCLETLRIAQPQLLLPKEPGQMSNGTQGAF